MKYTDVPMLKKKQLKCSICEGVFAASLNTAKTTIFIQIERWMLVFYFMFQFCLTLLYNQATYN